MREDRLFEIEYGYWFNHLNARAYRMIDLLLNLVQLLGGSAAAMAALGDRPAAVVASGFALAVCAAIGLLVQPAVKCEQHRACKAAWLKLKGRAHAMPDDDLAVSVRDIQSEGPSGLPGADMPAWNSAAAAIGRADSAADLNGWQRLLAWLY